jgi:hypothetical protein
MKLNTWEVRLGIALIASSAIIYLIKFIFLGDPENTYFYVFNALGFLPINVLLVTLILNQLLSVRAKRARLEKLNMVIGTFFSEVGTQLLTYLSDQDPRLDQIRGRLIVDGNWSDEDFSAVQQILTEYTYQVDVSRVNLSELHLWMKGERNFLLRLLENPVLLEHESFTELLRAAFHLAEELDRRKSLDNLPDTDRQHLAGDLNRVYGYLAIQWLNYMKYLKGSYPYLFSLALRTNPFDEKASPIVR